MSTRPVHLGKERGQALVIMTVAVAAVLAMTALVVDGGNAMANQRATQNAVDAASLAGASVIVEELAGVARIDADVEAAVADAFTGNDTDYDSAVYVDENGNVVGTVGQGGAIPYAAYGVRANGSRTFQTFLAGIAGISNLDSGAQATALAGAPEAVCRASEGCGILPVAFSIPIQVCDGTNLPLEIGEHWPLVDLATAEADTAGNYLSIVPLCKTGPGGVGWLDMSQVGCPGNNLDDWVRVPCNESFEIPVWLPTQSGNTNSIDSALQTHVGAVVLIPLFDATCRDVPSTGLPADCTDPGQGNNIWYHIPEFAAFLLKEVHVQGSNEMECNAPPGQPMGGGNGATSCLKGWFVRFITSGRVGLPRDCRIVDGRRVCGNSVLGIQLVR